MGHLNGCLARGGRNLNTNFPNIQMPWGGGGGVLKIRFDWHINKSVVYDIKTWAWLHGVSQKWHVAR